MAATANPSMHMATANPCISSSRKSIKPSTASFVTKVRRAAWSRLTSSSHLSSARLFFQNSTSTPARFEKVVTKAMADASENKPLPGLPVDLRGCTSSWFPICYYCCNKVFSYLLGFNFETSITMIFAACIINIVGIFLLFFGFCMLLEPLFKWIRTEPYKCSRSLKIWNGTQLWDQSLEPLFKQIRTEPYKCSRSLKIWNGTKMWDQSLKPLFKRIRTEPHLPMKIKLGHKSKSWKKNQINCFYDLFDTWSHNMNPSILTKLT